MDTPLRRAGRLGAGLVALALGCDGGGGPADSGAPTDGGAMQGEDTGAPRDAAVTDGGPVADRGATDGGAVRCREAEGSGTAPTRELVSGDFRATVESASVDGCLRAYTLRSTSPLRDGQPANPRRFEERASYARLRTRNELFDALYALALEEMRENSVASIRDGGFNNGGAIACPAEGCFETGRLWNYVWTRDTAFSAALALGSMDPLRTRNSLDFKLSERRAGGDLQVVQDTGTGGSWPVSTDRVAWALGARETLKFLDGTARTAFAERTFTALRNTVEHDRRAVFDERDGLYTGEQSFLDWREQSYPGWTATNNAHIAMSRSLSTNVLHWVALDTVASLARERNDATAAARYRGWADALRDRIRARFWNASARQFGAFVGTTLDPAVVRRWDALGTALAVITGVATPEQASQAVASYPRAGDAGPAVIWPQQQLTAIYHNRSAWPFVTAFWLQAARAVRNDATVERDVWAMMRGAALNLSNMENFEFPSGRARVEDGAYSGPVVNSQRQLWSVAGYLSMVHSTLFGMEASADGVRFRPYIPRGLRATLFANADTLVLDDLLYRGRHLTVVLRLPPGAASRAGAYAVGSVRLDGREVGDAYLTPAMLPQRATVEVTLRDDPEAAATVNSVDISDWRALFGPRTPTVSAVEPSPDGTRLQVRWGTTEEDRSALTFNVYRDGALVGEGLPGSTGLWVDPDSGEHRGRTWCYSVEAVFSRTGNHSQHSEPVCWWGAGGGRVTSIPARMMTSTGGQLSTEHGREHWGNWGDPGHRLEATVTARFTGDHYVQVVASNGSGGFTTGITCGVKRVTITDATSGEAVGTGVVAMPQTDAWGAWRDSSLVRVALVAGRRYRVTLGDDASAVNMSVFRHFERYTGGTGGASGPFTRVNVAEIKLLALTGTP